MIIDFKAIQHDFYGRVEQPVLTLKTVDGRVLSTIPNYYGLKVIFRYNDVSEIEFKVPAFVDGEPNPYYDDIIGMRKVEVEDIGDFIIVDPGSENEGGYKKTKTCKAYSLEYEFNYKKSDLAAGTYNFYNPIHNENTIMAIIIESMPDWSIGEVDRDLIGRWRTFENVDENLYSFMMKTLQESYNCLFLFDTKNKKINVRSAKDTLKSLPIYLSYNNLVKSVDITELSDEIVTALSGYGSGDDVNIRSLNPNGTNTIYNLDYFLSKNDLPSKLTDKWKAYSSNLELQQKVYSNFSIALNEKITSQLVAKSELASIIVNRDAIKTAFLEQQLSKQELKPDQIPEGWEEETKRLEDELNRLNADITIKEKYIEQLENERALIEDAIKEIVAACKLESFFTEDELKILTQYFKHESISEETFVIPEYASAIMDDNNDVIMADSNGILKITGTEKYATNVIDVFSKDDNGVYTSTIKTEKIPLRDSEGNIVYELVYDDDGNPVLDINGNKILATDDNGDYIIVYETIDDNQVNTNYGDLFNSSSVSAKIEQQVIEQLNEASKKCMYEFRGGVLSLEYRDVKISDGQEEYTPVKIKGDIVNVDFSYNTGDTVENPTSDTSKLGGFIAAITLHDATYNGVHYPTMNISIQGMLRDNAPQIGEGFMVCRIKSAIVYSSASVTEHQRQTVLQELYDYVETSLAKLAYPSYEFGIDSANFIFAQEFEIFKNQLELGSTIFLSLDDDGENILQPILIEVEMEYDDEAKFKIKFSDKFHSSSSEFELADLITDVTHTSHSVSLNKANYAAFKDSQVGNQVNEMMRGAFDVAKNNIVNSANQSIDIGSTGAFFRKKLKDGTFSPEQVGIVNNTIALTKDSFNSVEIAIGKIFDNNTGIGYGIAAPQLFGTILAGENLVIQNTVVSEDGKTVQKEFRVDSSGVWMNNASFVISKDADTDIGYIGGKIFIDPRYGIAAGNLDLFDIVGTDIHPNFLDENGKTIFEEGSLYAPKNATFWLDIRTGDAYFGGTINAKNIIAGTLNGSVIADNSISVDKIQIDDISAFGATIGGFDVNNNSISRGSNTFNSMHSFYFGVSGLSIKNKFVVTSDGVLTTIDSDISGKVTSYDGVIGGWDIEGTCLSATDPTNSGRYVKLNSSGSGELLTSDTVGYASHALKGSTYKYHNLSNYVTINASGIDLYNYSNNSYTQGIVIRYDDGIVFNIDKSGIHNEVGNGINLDIEDRVSVIGDYINLVGEVGVSKDLHVSGGIIQTADRNKQRNARALEDKYLQLFDLLEPISHKETNSTQTHLAFSGQTVETAMAQLGMGATDFGGLNKYQPVADRISTAATTNEYGLNYNEFVVLNTAKIKQLEQKIIELQNQIQNLRN